MGDLGVDDLGATRLSTLITSSSGEQLGNALPAVATDKANSTNTFHASAASHLTSYWSKQVIGPSPASQWEALKFHLQSAGSQGGVKNSSVSPIKLAQKGSI